MNNSEENDLTQPLHPGDEPAPEENSPDPFDFSTSGLDDLGFTPLPTSATPIPTRRRRARQPVITRPSVDEIADRLEDLARRAAPTFDYFVFSIVAGALLGTGYLLDSPAILFFGIIAAPLLTPWLGAALALATGEARYLGQTLGGFFTSMLIILLIGMLAGLASRLLLPATFSQASLHAHLWWPDFLLLTVGALLFTLTFIQSQDKPILSGLVLSYGIYLPLSAAGFGIGNGVEGVFPQALLVFGVHLALSLLLLLAVFYFMGFRPLARSGYLWGAGAAALSLALIGGIAGLGSFLSQPSRPTPVQATSAPTISLPTLTPQKVLATTTPIVRTTSPITTTSRPATATFTPVSTPVYGKILSRGGDGAVIRKAPEGPAITTISNGYVVEILPDAPVTLASGTTWVHVRVKTNSQVIEGWVQLTLIITSTPAP